MCRVCRKEVESTSHILTGCNSLAKKEYLEWHNNVARYLHFEICKRYGIQTETKWHLHRPKEVYMDNRVELLWDMTLTTDRAVGQIAQILSSEIKNKKEPTLLM